MADEIPKMPWGFVAKGTAIATAVTAATLTVVAATALARYKEEIRPRWTDAARWE